MDFHHCEFRSVAAVNIFEDILSELLKKESVRHSSANSSKPEEALSNVIQTYESRLKELKSLKVSKSLKSVLFSKKPIDISKLDFSPKCCLLKSIPNFITETENGRNSRKKDLLKSQKCEINGIKCKKISCCSDCKFCDNCEVSKNSCDASRLRGSVQIALNLRNTACHTNKSQWKDAEQNGGLEFFGTWEELCKQAEIAFRTILEYLGDVNDERELKLSEILYHPYEEILKSHTASVSNQIKAIQDSDKIAYSQIFQEKYNEVFEKISLPWNRNSLLKTLDIYIKMNFLCKGYETKKINLFSLFDIIESRKWKKIALIANGGMGKTILGKFLCQRWSKFKSQNIEEDENWSWLIKFHYVIHIDVRDIKGSSNDDIYNAILRLTGVDEPSKVDRDKLRKRLHYCEEKVLFILDSFDEADDKSREAANNFFSKEAIFRKSIVFILSRPEGREDLEDENSIIHWVDLKPLQSKQINSFIKQKYTFKDDPDQKLENDIIRKLDVSSKRKRLLSDRRNSKINKELLCYPIYLIMLCGLYDDSELSFPLDDGLDIYLAVIALVIKTEFLKTNIRKKEWNRMNSVEIIQHQLEVLSALGYAIYKCNNDCFNKYEFLKEERIKEHMKKVLKDFGDDDFEACLRWGFIDRIVRITTERPISYVGFTHRNFRDIITSFYLKNKNDDEEKKLGSVEPEALYYALDLVRKGNPVNVVELKTVFEAWKKSKECSEIYLAHLFLFYAEFSNVSSVRGMIYDYIIEFITLFVKKNGKDSKKTGYFFSVPFKLKSDGNLKEKSEKYLQNYLEVLVAHFNYSTPCKSCVLPRKVRFLLKKPKENEPTGPSSKRVMYSENTTYGVFPLLYVERKNQLNISVFVLPHIEKGHVTQDSQYAHFNSKDYNLKNLRKVEKRMNQNSEESRRKSQKRKKNKRRAAHESKLDQLLNESVQWTEDDFIWRDMITKNI